VTSSRSSHRRALDVWIGRWINTDPAVATSDVYEWAPSGAFVLHTADGAIEIIDYDEPSGRFTSRLVDAQGNVELHRLIAHGDTWTYEGDATRATVQFSDDHRVQTVVRERTDEGTSSRVRLVKVSSR
jgi:hypothetical protein